MTSVTLRQDGTGGRGSCVQPEELLIKYCILHTDRSHCQLYYSNNCFFFFC